eukprot:TRINITY_DN21805_c0_g1_i2.p1 TRINITY_DN21805_c0_g1~~TRINITY_DN21805_c0_g1_i2.p1  ORF type:complete len:225 (-),score=26.33 TRINITY_DN21805_c0_g1_i2:110-784(-)
MCIRDRVSTQSTWDPTNELKSRSLKEIVCVDNTVNESANDCGQDKSRLNHSVANNNLTIVIISTPEINTFSKISTSPSSDTFFSKWYFILALAVVGVILSIILFIYLRNRFCPKKENPQDLSSPPVEEKPRRKRQHSHRRRSSYDDTHRYSQYRYSEFDESWRKPIREVSNSRRIHRRNSENGGRNRYQRHYNTGKYQYDPSNCLLYTSPSPRDLSTSRMPSSA